MSRITKEQWDAAYKFAASFGEDYYNDLIDRYFGSINSPMYSHMIFNHFRKTDYDMMHRILSNRNVSGVSVFDISEEEVVKLIVAKLKEPEMREDLLTWLYLARNDLCPSLYEIDPDCFDCGRVIGHGYLRGRERHVWDNGALQCTSITVAIGLDHTNPYGTFFRVATAYPYLDGMGCEKA